MSRIVRLFENLKRDGRKGMIEGRIVIRDVVLAPKPGLEAAA